MKRIRRKNRTGLFLVMTVVLLFCGTLGLHSISLRADCQSLEEQKQELEDKKNQYRNSRRTCRQMSMSSRWQEKSLVLYMITKLFSKQSENHVEKFFGHGSFFDKIRYDNCLYLCLA